MPTNRKRRIIIVSELFYPDEASTGHILTKISNHLMDYFDVLVITASQFPKESSINQNNELLKEKNIIRICQPKLSKKNLISRSMRLCILSGYLCLMTWKKVQKDDIVFTVTNPAPLIVLLALIRRFINFHLVLLVHDVFPENAVATGIMRQKSLLYKIVRNVFDKAYARVNIFISIGRDMSEIIEQKVYGAENKIVLIENWADQFLQPSATKRHTKSGVGDKIVIQYAGNIGLAQGCVEFLDIVSQVDNPNIKFIFRGFGVFQKP